MPSETGSEEQRPLPAQESGGEDSEDKNGLQPSVSNLPSSKFYTSPSATEWTGLKNEGKQNEPLDRLMSLVGLERVKEHFLNIYHKVRTAQDLGLEFPKGEFNINISGNQGTGRPPFYAAHNTHIYRITESNDMCVGKSTICELYDKFLETLEVEGQARESKGESKGESAKDSCLTMMLPDYDNEELLDILRQMLSRKPENTTVIEDGENGGYLRAAIRKLRNTQPDGVFRNIWSLQDFVLETKERQRKRVTFQLRQGIEVDSAMITKEDLIPVGEEPPKCDQIQALAELEDMVELKHVKSSISSLINQVNRNYHLELQGKDSVTINVNRVFLGDLGTGKRTVAALYGRILAELGLVSGTTITIKAASEIIEELEENAYSSRKHRLAQTEILIITDVHLFHGYKGSRYESDAVDSFIEKVLPTAAKESTSKKRCVLLTGKEKETKELFKKNNLSLAHAFSLEEAFYFPKLDKLELEQILDMQLRKRQLQLSSAADDIVRQILARACRRPDFKNGNEIDHLLTRAEEAHRSKISDSPSHDKNHFITLEVEDLDAKDITSLGLQGESLFDSFIGNEAVISRFEGYQRTAAGMRRYDMDPQFHIPFTFVFRGPPGTGKTTTARKIGTIFYNLGFISESEVVERSVTDLIGEYVGHTGPKTLCLLEKALGKVLFIDEAYRLREEKFAQEAVAEIVDALTKERFQRKLIIILAGYEEDMEQLMQKNQGLRSRFPTNIDFKPMEPTNCVKLLQRCLSKMRIHLELTDDPESLEMKKYLNFFQKLAKFKSWANARSVEKIASDVACHVYGSLDVTEEIKDTLTVSFTDILSAVKSAHPDDKEIQSIRDTVGALFRPQGSQPVYF